MFNGGVDFGSTYTTISRYREGYNRLETVTMGEAIPYIPSVAALEGSKKKHWKFGTAAKAKTGQSKVQTFKAFKMLLTETDKKKLEERSYTDEYTPAAVAKLFLTEQIKKAVENSKEAQVGRLVIGAPEIWFKRVETIDGRNILRDICREICKEINGTSNAEVQVVSEPAAACAYFAHNFETLKKRNYEGTILLVDYGGGTLDISLSKVTTEKSDDGRSYMEIRVIESNGAGEGVDKEIGQAGIVYMEKVMETAISEAMDGEIPERDCKFYKAVNDFELCLQSEGEMIKEVFDDYGIDDMDDLEEEEFTSIEYKGVEIPVTFATLVKVYNQVIRNVLDSRLEEMCQFAKNKKINVMDKEQEDFKIAIVGGFGNFYLVRRQVEEKFELSTHDKRTESIIVDKSDCEKAVSYGTALLAADKIRIKQTAPYSLGLYQTDLDGRPYIEYSFTYKQDIKYMEPYFPLDEETGEPSPIFVADDKIDKFIYNRGHNDETAIVVPLKEHIKQKLTNIVKNPYRTAVIGFSMDKYEVVSLHIREYDLLTNTVSEKDNKIELTRYNDMFEFTKVKKVLDM